MKRDLKENRSKQDPFGMVEALASRLAIRRAQGERALRGVLKNHTRNHAALLSTLLIAESISVTLFKAPIRLR